MTIYYKIWTTFYKSGYSFIRTDHVDYIIFPIITVVQVVVVSEYLTVITMNVCGKYIVV